MFPIFPYSAVKGLSHKYNLLIPRLVGGGKSFIYKDREIVIGVTGVDSGEKVYFRRSEGLFHYCMIVDKPVDNVEK